MTHEHKTRVLTDSEINAIAGGGGGQNVAERNHNSGLAGASGNPKPPQVLATSLSLKVVRAMSEAVHLAQSL